MVVRWLAVAVALVACLGVAGTNLDEDATMCMEGECREGFSTNSTAGFCENSTGMCNCSQNSFGQDISCLVYLNKTNRCALDKCYRFNEEAGLCQEGVFSRTAALCLSIFLINFGAANFYIERYELAVPQIVLGLLLCIFQVSACAAAGLRDDETSKACVICCSINSLFSLLFLAWWVADLIFFALNTRLDGNGCPLFT